MDSITLKLKGAWNIIVANAFFDTHGNISYGKIAAISAFIVASVWLFPNILKWLVIAILAAAGLYVAYIVLSALFNGELDAAGKL